MLVIPTEIQINPIEYSIDDINRNYLDGYEKSLPDDLTKAIDNVTWFASYEHGTHEDDRFNVINFITVHLIDNNVFTNNKNLCEIAKAVFRTIRKQTFLIFSYSDKIKYSAAFFWANKMNYLNNTVRELIISEPIISNTPKHKNAEDKIQRLLQSEADSKQVYSDIYQALFDICSYEMNWDSSYDIDKLYKNDFINLDIDDSKELPYYEDKEKPSPEYLKQKQEYKELKIQADKDITGEFQFKFAKKNQIGIFARPQVYVKYLHDAARNKYKPAQIELAKVYEEGTLVEKDLLFAYKLYHAAGEATKTAELFQEIKNQLDTDELL